jgi:hypothetical protein
MVGGILVGLFASVTIVRIAVGPLILTLSRPIHDSIGCGTSETILTLPRYLLEQSSDECWIRALQCSIKLKLNKKFNQHIYRFLDGYGS